MNILAVIKPFLPEGYLKFEGASKITAFSSHMLSKTCQHDDQTAQQQQSGQAGR